jgi:hypothetical protein
MLRVIGRHCRRRAQGLFSNAHRAGTRWQQAPSRDREVWLMLARRAQATKSCPVRPPSGAYGHSNGRLIGVLFSNGRPVDIRESRPEARAAAVIVEHEPPTPPGRGGRRMTPISPDELHGRDRRDAGPRDRATGDADGATARNLSGTRDRAVMGTLESVDDGSHPATARRRRNSRSPRATRRRSQAPGQRGTEEVLARCPRPRANSNS